MTYDVLEKKIKSLTESYFQEVSDYLDTLIIRMNVSEEKTTRRDLGVYLERLIKLKYFGLMYAVNIRVNLLEYTSEFYYNMVIKEV